MSESAAPYILVVDDDRDIRELLCELLEENGYRAVGLTNGREALELLRGSALPCVILLDLMMPVMNGLEFIREQQEDTRLREIPVALITAAADQHIGAVSVSHLLRKPLRIEDLLSVLKQHCC